MPKIIKAGQLPGDKEYEMTCTSCKTVFSFKKSEAKPVYDQREGSYHTINCPLNGCNKLLTTTFKTPSGSYRTNMSIDPY